MRSISLICLFSLVATCFATPYAYSEIGNKYLVLGVIADSRPNRGVALLKAESTSKTFAIRAGDLIDSEIKLDSVSRDYVYFKVQDKIHKIKVGDSMDPANPKSIYTAAQEASIHEGIERQGNTVKISSTLREYVAGPSLSKILMQAAAVPQYVNGELRGFGLYEIEKESIYEKAGFVNGDIITSINGQHLSNVGQAIKVLHSLKNETEVEVELTRDGVEQKLYFQVK